ncbi:MAG: tRNA (N6-threonylcarbamoyladenosine(37)-N6)-methyltransferase TrmO [Candidatus Methanoliparum thermophilum]|uniref:tRNA (N6-threonylcarbamoyladenosine(37)-N6)-methyltransferase TrmO n=1 Tax=Methanoliparum thermophilum TaxID=2491083 RepID=A0A520KSF9_METT2|nr:tRNA (N6-threonylcarbamoyladenosine(37)-N6)-methyltransferase TrmO [Candidatus Methanoliparum sp. LAM-1]RZN64846.1 MAG: tRNA (N6-threonylcarbamoyladenosine(37)-N6)-methyltransferase TrmO [Candidatus Methanoliparum thermophilum]
MTMITLKPIGVLHSRVTRLEEVPFQWMISSLEGDIEIFEEYTEGLQGIEDLDYIVVIFFFHKSTKEYSLIQKPPWSDKMRGVFSICSPLRPNPIGLSVVRLLSVKDNILHVKNIDMVDGTPILDIKPYIPLKKDNEPLNSINL